MDAIYFTLLFKALVMGGRNINISLRLPSMRKTPIRPRRRDTDARFSAPPHPPLIGLESRCCTLCECGVERWCMAVILGHYTAARCKLRPGFTFVKNGPAGLYVTISLLIMLGVPRCSILFYFLSPVSERRIRIWRHPYTRGVSEA